MMGRGLFLLVAGALLSGCGSDAAFDRLEYRDAIGLEDGVTLSEDGVTMPVGYVVVARISAIGDDGKALPLIRFESEDPETFDVELGPEVGWYALVAAAPGQTRVRVVADGSERGFFQAFVVEAPVF